MFQCILKSFETFLFQTTSILTTLKLLPKLSSNNKAWIKSDTIRRDIFKSDHNVFFEEH